MFFKVSGFEWDKGNKLKCRKHGLSLKQIESVFKQKSLLVAPDVKHSDRETRYIGIGKVKLKPVFVVFTIREIEGEQYIRPISARYMHKKEREKYEKENF